MSELLELIAALDDPNLTLERWRELYAKAGELVEQLGAYDFIEPFVIAGDRVAAQRRCASPIP